MNKFLIGLIFGCITTMLYQLYSASYDIWLAKFSISLETYKKERYLDQYVLNYIEVNPNIFEQISKRQQKSYSRNVEQIKLNAVQLENKPNYSKAVVYELLDYNCIYCKKFHNKTATWIAENTDYEIQYIQLPIISDSSFLISKLFIATGYLSKKKQTELHELLMQFNGYMSEESLYEIITALGLDVQALEELAEDNGIEKSLKEVILLAQKIGVTGTPAFIKDNNLLIGSRNRIDFLKFLNKQPTGGQI